MSWFRKKVCKHKHKQVGSSLDSVWAIYQCEKCNDLMMGGYTTQDHKLLFGGTLKLKEVISVYASQDPDALHKEIMIKSSPEFNMSRQSFYGRIVSEEEEFDRKWKDKG